MNSQILRAFIATGALAALCASWGCVADRPSRNGVYNENQYVRKSFLVKPADPNVPDPGWMLQATVLSTSTPNPLALGGQSPLWAGSQSSGNGGTSYVRFNITSDKLQMVNMRELSAGYPTQGTRDGEVLNAWPVTNVDLKYRINLDGEKTNFFEENQELDWQQRQWVKVNFDKNDMSDVAPFGAFAQSVLSTCTDVGNISATLVPGSFMVDEPNNYITWQVQVTAPVSFNNTTCTDAYGTAGVLFQKLGRQSVTFTMMYSLVRAAPDSGIWTAKNCTSVTNCTPSTYVPFEIAEKDPIRRKYGTLDIVPISRDPNSGLVAARQLATRFNPNSPIVWYFAQGYPEEYKGIFTDPGGIVDQTNQLFLDAGAKATLSLRNYDDPIDLPPGEGPRQYGDVRYNFIRWQSDLDVGVGFIGVTQPFPDPRTGEQLAESIMLPDFALQDRMIARLQFYLQTIGADPTVDPQGTCKDGDVAPLGGLDNSQGGVIQTNHNAISTVYDKMQTYLHKPVAQYGHLGPSDFIVQQDADFFNSFFATLPYQIYNDPATNPFVIPEGGAGSFGPAAQWAALADKAAFHKMMADVDHGYTPFDDADTGIIGTQNAVAFTDKFKTLTHAFSNQQYLARFNHGMVQYDDASMLSYFNVFQKDGRHCITDSTGQTRWETYDEYIQNLVRSYRAQTIWHEFGHALGLEHNFMGSVDRRNFPHYTDGAGRDHIGEYSSSLMEYNVDQDRIFWSGASSKFNGKPGWGHYDQGAITFLYANNQDSGHVGPSAVPQGAVPTGVSGQVSATAPWNDPHGWSTQNKAEIAYLFCGDTQIHYSPFCRQFDFGSTPSEIIANDIDYYEWQYRWRNYRLYRKFWDDAPYADGVTNTFTELRRFLSSWLFDWSDSELAHNFPKLGIVAPPNVPEGNYYANLIAKWHNDISVANQMVAAFHKAIIQQGSGERPFASIYDAYFGDVTQQGIIIDKLLSQQDWTGLFQIDNYDVTQSQGLYVSPVIPFDPAYQGIAEDAVDSMVGGQYDIFVYARPLGVTTFAQATHDINFPGRIELRDWVGGKVFYTERDLLDFFHDMAATFHFMNPADGVQCDTGKPLDSCTYDPRIPRSEPDQVHQSDTFNEFTGPDGRRYIWAYVDDRHTWTVVDRDRNTASYVILRNYTTDVINFQDDGFGGAYDVQRPIKYFLDSFNMFN